MVSRSKLKKKKTQNLYYGPHSYNKTSTTSTLTQLEFDSALLLRLVI